MHDKTKNEKHGKLYLSGPAREKLFGIEREKRQKQLTDQILMHYMYEAQNRS